VRNQHQLLVTCIAIFVATLFLVPDAHAQKGGKGGGGNNHNHNHNHGGGGGGRSFIDISPWGIGYGYQNNNFGISVGPVGGGLINGGFGGPVYNAAPVYDPYMDPWYGQPVMPMANPGYVVPSQPVYYGSQPVNGNPVVNPPRTNPQPARSTSPTSANIPGRPVGNTWFDQSQTAFRDGDYANANRLAMHALLDAPESGWLKLYASQCQLAIGEYVASAELLASGLESAPDEQWNSVVANFREFYHRNDYVSHVKQLEEKVQKGDTSSWGKALLGYHYLFLGHPTSAKKVFDASLQINPNDPIAKRLLPLAEPVQTSKPGVESPTPALDAGKLPPLQPEEIRSDNSVLNRK